MRGRHHREVCVLLPNKERLYITVGVKAKGQEVFSRVSDLLGVKELHFFGLSVLHDCEHLFLDLEQKLTKYLGKERKQLKDPVQLFLRVQYYVESGRMISSSKALTLYYADLRQRVLQSHQGIAHEDTIFRLAAYALQVEVGDVSSLEERDDKNRQKRGGRDMKDEGVELKEEQECSHYFLPEDFFPPWVIRRRGREYILQHLPGLHADLRGFSRQDATLLFIKEASALQDVSVVCYRMSQSKKKRKCCILLGVSLRGMFIYQEVDGIQTLLHELSWKNIDRFTFQGRRLELQAVGFPKLLFYTPSAFHSVHMLRHLSDSHRLHMNTRASAALIRKLEESHVSTLHHEAYICNRAALGLKLSHGSRGSKCLASREVVQTRMWTGDIETISLKEIEICVDEPVEVSVDDPENLMWLAEQSEGVSVDDPYDLMWLAEQSEEVSVDGPLVMPVSHWADVAMEMKPVLKLKALKVCL
ncbi:FERM domain-containing protein 6-like isoform X2 [Hypomesus transpacificus]|uniref:FERM domain-containing protein 6-like isoform X2 n=1 Tax=Hypomesus transpacificus TaxID=137520 RepID=UPI001F086F81|nr:FERM domain-containing protein 6-like isoform X2 [Hypomesus transpacificus]